MEETGGQVVEVVAKKSTSSTLLRKRSTKDGFSKPKVVPKMNPNQSVPPLRALAAEVIGTCLLCCGGTGIVVVAVYTQAQFDLFHVAFVWGTTATLAISVTAEVSGAHLNPGVSFALAVFKGFPLAHVPMYVLAQLVGATLASLIVYFWFFEVIDFKTKGISRDSPESLGLAPGCMFYFLGPGKVTNSAHAVALEATEMALLLFVLLCLTDARSKVPGPAVPTLMGTTVFTIISLFGPLTAAGFNPARDLGSRFVAAAFGWGSGVFEGAWVYTVGPFIGALIGGGVYSILYPIKHGQLFELSHNVWAREDDTFHGFLERIAERFHHSLEASDTAYRQDSPELVKMDSDEFTV